MYSPRAGIFRPAKVRISRVCCGKEFFAFLRVGGMGQKIHFVGYKFPTIGGVLVNLFYERVNLRIVQREFLCPGGAKTPYPRRFFTYFKRRRMPGQTLGKIHGCFRRCQSIGYFSQRKIRYKNDFAQRVART